jgi:hypothetical protein
VDCGGCPDDSMHMEVALMGLANVEAALMSLERMWRLL